MKSQNIMTKIEARHSELSCNVIYLEKMKESLVINSLDKRF